MSKAPDCKVKSVWISTDFKRTAPFGVKGSHPGPAPLTRVNSEPDAAQEPDCDECDLFFWQTPLYLHEGSTLPLPGFPRRKAEVTLIVGRQNGYS